MTRKRRKMQKNAGKHLKSTGKHYKKLFYVLFYNINNYLKDIKWYYNKFKWVKFKYFDTVSESGFRRDTSPAFFRHINIVTCILLNEVNNYFKERKEKEPQNAEFFFYFI